MILRVRHLTHGIGGRWLGAGLAALVLIASLVYAATEKITGKIDESEDEEKPGWIRWTIRDKSTKRRASVYYEKDKGAAYIDAEALGEQQEQGTGQIKDINAKGSK